MTFREGLERYISLGFSVLPCGLDKKPIINTWEARIRTLIA